MMIMVLVMVMVMKVMVMKVMVMVRVIMVMMTNKKMATHLILGPWTGDMDEIGLPSRQKNEKE